MGNAISMDIVRYTATVGHTVASWSASPARSRLSVWHFKLFLFVTAVPWNSQYVKPLWCYDEPFCRWNTDFNCDCSLSISRGYFDPAWVETAASRREPLRKLEQWMLLMEEQAGLGGRTWFCIYSWNPTIGLVPITYRRALLSTLLRDTA
jgi:hypothetical protein